MEIQKTTKLEVAKRFEALLKCTLPAFKERIYWVIEDGPPDAAIADQEVVTFSFQGGQFDYLAQVGGVPLYNGTIKVRFWATNFSSEAGSDRELLLSEPFGLYTVEQHLLTMIGNNLENGNYSDAILTEGIKALNDSESKATSEGAYSGAFKAMLSVDFMVDFYWDTNANRATAIGAVPSPPFQDYS
jgi:hypothetical protein